MATHHNNEPKPYKDSIEQSSGLNIPMADTTHDLTRTANPNSRQGLDPQQEESLIRYNHLTYLLYTLSFFTAGILWIVPIIMNYARRGDAKDSWLATHFDWQIKTFWYSIVFGVMGLIVMFIGLGSLGIGVFAESSHVAIGGSGMTIIGGLIFALSIIWHIYRIIRGWIALSDKRPVP